MAANDQQVGGTHYRSVYQHWDFVTNLGMSYLEAQVAKYLIRWRSKNGLEDLHKAQHFLDKVIEVAPLLIMQKPKLPKDWISTETDKFVVANKIEGPERIILHLLANWECMAQLLDARRYLAGLIKQVRSDETIITKPTKERYRGKDDEAIHATYKE